jgi:hypothetical protein
MRSSLVGHLCRYPPIAMQNTIMLSYVEPNVWVEHTLNDA